MIIVANWKANNVSTTSWLTQTGVDNDTKIVIAAPFTMLFLLASGPYLLGAQDVSMFPPGAYTGEVPAELLSELDVVYCLVGHSERRKLLGETTEVVGKKMARALEAGIIPIVCAQSFEEIPDLALNTPGEKFIVMFEPFEAISKEGKNNAVEPEKVRETVSLWKTKLPAGVKVLYGGSVNSNNVKDYASFVDGFVVGHASLDQVEFLKLIANASTSKN